jgi:hypothetical protein
MGSRTRPSPPGWWDPLDARAGWLAAEGIVETVSGLSLLVSTLVVATVEFPVDALGSTQPPAG